MEHIGTDLMANRAQIITNLLNRYRQIQDTGTDQSDMLIKLKRDAEKQLNKKEMLLEYSLDGAITKDEFRIMNERLEKSLQQTRIKIASIEKNQAMQDDASSQFLKLEQYLKKEIDNNSYPIEVARNLLERIVVLEDSVDEHIKLKVLMRHGEATSVAIVKLNILCDQTDVLCS